MELNHVSHLFLSLLLVLHRPPLPLYLSPSPLSHFPPSSHLSLSFQVLVILGCVSVSIILEVMPTGAKRC